MDRCCLEAAAKMAGSNPNVEQQARAFYEFVTEGQGEPVRSILATAEGGGPPSVRWAFG
jgi:hypothetical protein